MVALRVPCSPTPLNAPQEAPGSQLFGVPPFWHVTFVFSRTSTTFFTPISETLSSRPLGESSLPPPHSPSFFLKFRIPNPPSFFLCSFDCVDFYSLRPQPSDSSHDPFPLKRQVRFDSKPFLSFLFGSRGSGRLPISPIKMSALFGRGKCPLPQVSLFLFFSYPKVLDP